MSYALCYVEVDIPAFLTPFAVATTRFAQDTAYLPSDIDAIPSLVSVSINPVGISLGEDLGQRATVTVRLRDHRHVFSSESYTSGTFFGKFRARYGLKLRGRALRIIRGTLGQTLAEMETRHFIIDSCDGPTMDGEYRIVGKDVLKLADGDRALAPLLNSGILQSNLAAGGTSCVLLPAGIGNAEYAASGFVAIGGNEITSFTRAGDTLTLGRGALNTADVAHQAEDKVQQLLVYSGQDPAVIIRDLLVTYAGVPTGYINLSEWQAETAAHLGVLYGANIAEPTSVNTLISELVEQAALAIWWDDVAQKIRLQVLRSISTSAVQYTEQEILAESIEVEEQPEKRLTHVSTYYGKINPLLAEDQIQNYRNIITTFDATAVTDYGSKVIKKIYSRWIPSTGRAVAARANDIQLGRFVNPPRKLKFAIQRYSGGTMPALGDGCNIYARVFQDTAGAEVAVPAQITRLNPMEDRLDCEAEEMLFTTYTTGVGLQRTLTFSANQNNVGTLLALHNGIYPAVTAPDILSGVFLLAVVNSGVILGATSTAIRTLEVGLFPTTTATGNTTNGSPTITGVSVNVASVKVGTHVSGAGIPNKAKVISRTATTLTLDMNCTATAGITLTLYFYIELRVIGRLEGCAGAGGNGSAIGSGAAGVAGGNGGLALYSRYPIDLDVDLGAIFSGGGGGGGGGNLGAFGGGCGGGGGGGQLPGAGGSEGGAGVVGQPGTTEAGGLGGTNGSTNGGNGGGPGLSGLAGQSATTAGGPGGVAGAAIDGISFVTVIQGPGDIRGGQIN